MAQGLPLQNGGGYLQKYYQQQEIGGEQGAFTLIILNVGLQKQEQDSD